MIFLTMLDLKPLLRLYQSIDSEKATPGALGMCSLITSPFHLYLVREGLLEMSSLPMMA